VRSRVEAISIAAVSALALLVRVVVVLSTRGYVPTTDAKDFDRLAVSLATTGHFPRSLANPLHVTPTALRPPAWSWALSLVYRVVGVADAHRRWEAGRMFEAVLGALAVLLLMLIVRRLWGNRIALVTGGLAAVYPPLILAGTSLLSESLFIPAVLGAVLAALEMRQTGRWWWGVAAGALVTLATLTRSNGAIVGIPLLFLVWTGKPRFSWRALRAPAVIVVAAVIVLTPWMIRNEQVFHSFVPTSTEGGFALAGTYNQADQDRRINPAFWGMPAPAMVQILEQNHDVNEQQMDSKLTRVGLDYIKAHPASVVKTSWLSFLRLLDLDGSQLERSGAILEAQPVWLTIDSIYAFWVAGLLAIGGIVVLRRRFPGQGGPAAFWWCPAVLFLSNVPFIGDTRYRSPADPFMLILTAFAVIELWRLLAARMALRRQPHAPVASAPG
jgi:4-amino-4-deoxy-L-arabinose transferase-like glycosyltransferase